MPIVDMNRITVVGLRRDRDQLLQSLARVGAIDIEDVSAMGRPALLAPPLLPEVEGSDNIVPASGADSPEALALVRAQEAAARLEALIALCSRLAPEQKKKKLASRRSMSGADFIESVEREPEIWAAADAIQQLRSQAAAARGQISRMGATADLLQPWAGVPFDLASDGTRLTRVWLGFVPAGARYDDFAAALAAEVPRVHISILHGDAATVRLAVVAMREDEEQVRVILKAHSFTAMPVQGETGTPDEILARIGAERIRLEAEIETLEAQSVVLMARRPDFEVLYDHYAMEIDRLKSAARLRHTRSSFILSGWIPAMLGAETERGLRARFTVAVEQRSPVDGENVPVLVENIPLVRPYEVITSMFSTPMPSEIDPNPLMAPFFVILFGLMLNDAGYGLLLAIGCAVLVWGVKVRGNLRSMSLLMMQGGIAGIAAGLLFGSFFGDIITVASSQRAAFPTIWFNPLEDPVKMMIVSMGLGVIHVFTGMGAKAYMLIRDKKPIDALLDVGSWYFTLIGLGLLAVGGLVGTIGTVMAVTGCIMVVLFSARSSRNPVKRVVKGLYNLYGITGYFSDILSYTRILALGLAGGVIAMVVNMIGSIAGFGIVGIILFILVALGGHTLNIALSVLGAYVHTSRLQYVEFFSKFFEGGGRPWTPLRAQTRYTEIKE